MRDKKIINTIRINDNYSLEVREIKYSSRHEYKGVVFYVVNKKGTAIIDHCSGFLVCRDEFGLMTVKQLVDKAKVLIDSRLNDGSFAQYIHRAKEYIINNGLEYPINK